jgi:hypothetical protein
MRRLRPFTVPLGVVAIVLTLSACSVVGHASSGHAAFTQQCAENLPATRDRANPLDLATAPGANPLTGARLYVPGPAKGAAASTIARLLGRDPDALSVSESWAQFAGDLRSGPLHAKLAADPTLARKVAELSLIAAEPEVQRISSVSWGGTPDGIFKQTQKLFCRNLTADPGAVVIINTYFLHPTLGGCPTPAAIRAYMPLFRARVNAMAAGVGRRPAVFLLELDAIGSSACVTRMHAMPEWEAALRYEMDAVRALPHTVVYLEGGYSDANSVAYTSRILNAIGVRKVRGFYVNGTHELWTSTEDAYATAIAKRTGGAHFVVNTADNGRGPVLNPHPATQGVEDLCNPANRGLGIRDTTDTGLPYADAYLWTHPPGNSSGCGGGPPGGTFWPQRAETEAAHADDQLGPGDPNEPYSPTFSR